MDEYSFFTYFRFYFVLDLDRIWRHGQVVRQGTANPLSPVQIWVSPDQQKTNGGFLILLI